MILLMDHLQKMVHLCNIYTTKRKNTQFVVLHYSMPFMVNRGVTTAAKHLRHTWLGFTEMKMIRTEGVLLDKHLLLVCF